LPSNQMFSTTVPKLGYQSCSVLDNLRKIIERLSETDITIKTAAIGSKGRSLTARKRQKSTDSSCARTRINNDRKINALALSSVDPVYGCIICSNKLLSPKECYAPYTSTSP
jgi:hypothetical protein